MCETESLSRGEPRSRFVWRPVGVSNVDRAVRDSIAKSSTPVSGDVSEPFKSFSSTGRSVEASSDLDDRFGDRSAPKENILQESLCSKVANT